MNRLPRSAVVATHNRRDELYRCLEALGSQCDHIVVIDNATQPPLGHDERDAVRLLECVDPQRCVLDRVSDDEQPPNLSRLWNLGIDRAADHWRSYWRAIGGEPQWDVAVVNDDATVPPGWFDRLSWAMRVDRGIMAASSCPPFAELGPHVQQYYSEYAPMSVHTRLTGWAFILRGEWPDARLDERFRWWCGDDDISLRARRAGGIVHVGGFPVPNEHADVSTAASPALQEQTGRDMQAFIDKWGFRPW